MTDKFASAAGSADASVAIMGVATTKTIAGPDFVVLAISLLQLLIFLSSLVAIYKIWMAVINFIGDQPNKKGELLVKMLGNINASADVGELKSKAIGTGLAGTVAILVLAVAAMYVIGNHTVT